MMTVEQVSEKYGYSVISLQKNFPKTSAAIEKKYGVTLIKCKKKGKTYYQIDDHRAETMYDQSKENINIGKKTLKLANYQFFVFLGILMTPQGIFRGTREDFLKYVGISATKKKISDLDIVLEDLAKRDFIIFDVDEDYIIVYVKRRIEKELQVGINMLKHCKDMINQKGKNSKKISQLIKVWLAIQICLQDQPFTYKDIADLTGLSIYQIRDAKKILDKKEVFNLSRAGTYMQNMGWEGDQSIFFDYYIEKE